MATCKTKKVTIAYSSAVGRLFNREFKQITTAGATTAAVTEEVWGELVPAVCHNLAKRNT